VKVPNHYVPIKGILKSVGIEQAYNGVLPKEQYLLWTANIDVPAVAQPEAERHERLSAKQIPHVVEGKHRQPPFLRDRCGRTNKVHSFHYVIRSRPFQTIRAPGEAGTFRIHFSGLEGRERSICLLSRMCVARRRRQGLPDLTQPSEVSIYRQQLQDAPLADLCVE
jgi:hypothetical protein